MPKVLIIEDEASMIDIIKQFLDKTDLVVEGATSGREGLQKAAAEQPDVIIVDIMMPEMNGYEVCQRLRQDPRTVRASILVLTARGQQIDREKAFEAGADAYMSKPFLGKALVEEIQRLAERPPLAPPIGYQVIVVRLQQGAGATMLAINLALCLARVQEGLIAIADMALPGGQIAGQLGLPPVDPQATSPTGGLVRYKNNIFALPMPPTWEANPPEPTAVVRLLQRLRAWHDYIVVDTPTHLGPLAPPLLRSSPLVLLLLTPDPKVMQAAQASLPRIKKLAGGTQRIWPVLNMVRAEQGAFSQQAEEVWGLQVAASLPWSPQECAESMTHHEPVVQRHPVSPLATAIQALAQQIVAGTEAQPPGVGQA
jgi:CheY-like chemotaxis protein